MRLLLLALPVLLACGPRDDAPRSGSFRVLTYNVQGLPDALTEYTWPLPDRMDRIAPFLDDYDLVGLQEDFDATGHAHLTDPAPHSARRWFDATVDSGRAYGAGLALLAEATEADYAEEHYTACSGTFDGASDCLASKGLQRLTLDLGGGALLDVYNTHHEAGGGEGDVEARAAQVEQVIAAMDARPDVALLFLGDMNLHVTDPDDLPSLERYAEAGLRDACEEVACEEPEHIDRVFARDGDDVRLVVSAWFREAHLVDEDGADLSDHPAIAVTVEWSRGE